MFEKEFLLDRLYKICEDIRNNKVIEFEIITKNQVKNISKKTDGYDKQVYSGVTCLEINVKYQEIDGY